jgi:anti-sigma B factor antagonist
MAIKTRTSGNVTILDVSGKITIDSGARELRAAVRGALDEGKTRLLLNMSGVTTVDSAGIGELVSSYSATGQRGGQLKLLSRPRSSWTSWRSRS